MMSNEATPTLPKKPLEDVEGTLKFLNEFLEQPQLLDPVMDDLLAPLLTRMMSLVVGDDDRAHDDDDDDDDVTGVHVCGEGDVDVFLLLYTVTKVRGWSCVLQRLSCEVRLIRPVAAFVEANAGPSWQLTFVCLLWLSGLALTPFALDVVNTGVALELLQLGKKHLSTPGKPSEAAALLLSNLLTRPDMNTQLAEFIDWATDVLRSPEASVYEQIPLYQSLCNVYKSGDRKMLTDTLPTDIFTTQINSQSSLMRKLAAKLAQRSGVLLLPPQSASWRYQRSTHMLLSGDASSSLHSRVSIAESGEPYEDWEVPADVDHVVDVLLTGLRDANTGVRWSCAKGIGRMTERLPLDFADEVVEAVLDLFSPYETEHSWHGACLALAELTRRGLLLPNRLADALPSALTALRYDMRVGKRSVGSQVRDAACYIFWSCARAYAPDVLEPHELAVATGLLCQACLDREINVRRAAAAALQEHVGRVGLVPHGISLVTNADYMTLASLSNAYTHVAPQVALFTEYRQPLVDGLLTLVKHWDIRVRQLAAQALGEICKANVHAISSEKLEILLSGATSASVETRHGCLLSLAAILKAGVQCGSLCIRLVPEIEKKRLFRGKGGEMMRMGVCKLVRALAEVKVPMDLKDAALLGRKTCLKIHKETMDDCLKHPKDEVCQEAASALGLIFYSYFGDIPAKVRRAVLNRYCGYLQDPQQLMWHKGSALVLGQLPANFIVDNEDLLLPAITQGCTKAAIVPMPEARAAVCAAAQHVVAISPAKCAQVVDDALQCAMRDYETDNRGDVGSWVREAALKTSFELYKDHGVGARENIYDGCLELLAGKLDRLRACANGIMAQIDDSWPSDLDRKSLFSELTKRAVITPKRGLVLNLMASMGAKSPPRGCSEGVLSELRKHSTDAFARCFLELLEEYTADHLFIGPLVAAFAIALENGLLLDVSHTPCVRLVDSLMRKSSSIPLLDSCARILVQLEAFSPLLDMLKHPYPVVRQKVSTLLQIHVATHGGEQQINQMLADKSITQFSV